MDSITRPLCHKYGMLCLMRTTVDIPDEVYRRLKAKAALDGTSIRNLLVRAAEVVLDIDKLPPVRRLHLPLIHSSRPGTLKITNEEIDEILHSS